MAQTSPSGTGPQPVVSVVMPAVDEADHLAAAVGAVLAQRGVDPLEVVLAVGPSADDTVAIAAELARTDPRIRVVDNPAGTTPAGLNRAIAAARGDIVARVDAHAELSPGYLRRAVEVLAETGAGNVGGIQRAVGDTPFQQAVAAAMGSRFGTGDARFHYGGEAGPIDTVYLGVFRRRALDQVGGFDESLVRNQDYELNIRLRDAGWTVWFDPGLEVTYHARATPRALARQYGQYGQWKRVVARRHPGSLRWRQVVPPVAVAANVLGLLAAMRWRPAALVPLGYVAATMGASVVEAKRQELATPVAARLPVAFAVMHHAWGLGFLAGGAESRPTSGQAEDPASRSTTSS